MGKFPGKSYKSVNRKRINVGLSECVALPENECLEAAKNVCLGLAVFRDLFGKDDEIEADYRGFDEKDVRKSIEHAEHTQQLCKARLEQEDFHDVMKCKSLDAALDLFLQLEYPNLQNTIKPTSDKITKRRQRLRTNKVSSTPVDNKDNSTTHNSSISNPLSEPISEASSLKKITAQRLLQRAKKSSTNAAAVTEPSPVVLDKGATGAIRKFVLPFRSVRSSRVIKPSKRVMESEEVLSERRPIESDIDVKKRKLTRASRSKSQSFIVETLTRSDSNNASLELTNSFVFNHSEGLLKSSNILGEDNLIVEGKRRWKPTYKVQLKLRELNVFGAGTSRLSSSGLPGSRSNSSRSEQCQTSSISSCSSDSNETVRTSEDSNPQWPSPSTSGSKVILRKARLKLATQTYNSTEGSFSAGFSSNSILGNFSPVKGKKILRPGTVECGVCGAVRFYKFVKQARKFGVFCCESCRKFVAKMIQKDPKNSQILECHRGEGMCKNIPIVRSQQWKTGQNMKGSRSLYKSRCPACWLKLCLRCFNMPDDVRQQLLVLLPVTMRSGITVIPLNDATKIRPGDEEECLASEVKVAASKPKVSKSVESKVNIRPNKREIKAASRYLPGEEISVAKPKEIQLNQKILKKASKNLVKSSLKRSGKKKERKGSEGDRSRRQKVDLKGPRVKHVCRSASVVLGQPQATFPNINAEKSQSKLTTDPIPSVGKTLKVSSQSNSDSEAKSMDVDTKRLVPVTAEVPNIPPGAELVEDVPCVVRKPIKLPPPPPLVKPMQVLPGKLPCVEEKSLVSIDFWESYDPEEVCNTGFGLIASEPFHVRAMCFLCGSAGLEKLIHCASCCEPFHRFCLYDGLRDATMSLMNSKDEWRLDWVCQRCKVCHSCGQGSGQQLSCQRCRRTYHTSCLGNGISRLHSPDRPWVCSSCLRCNSCGIANVTQFVGNLPFCNTCFKLRKKGNYCPLCQKCYEDDDYDSKMMECGRCKCWVHAKCEGVSDEKYQVLSFLPESVEFVCRNCCAVGPWRASVEDALKSGYTAVIKALSKNRRARALLKYSPKKKSCLCRAPPKRVPFPELEDPDSAKEDVINNVPVEEEVNKEVSRESPLLQLGGKQLGGKQLVISLVKVDLPVGGSESPKTSEPPTLEASLKEKYKIRDCSVCVDKINEMKESAAEDGSAESLDSTFSDCSADKSPPKSCLLAVTPSDSGIGSADDELKVSSDEVVIEPVRVYAPSTGVDYTSGASEDAGTRCLCMESFRSQPTLTLLDIKKKVDNCEYLSLLQFNQEMEHLLMLSGSETEELLAAYYHSLKDLFPWFDPKLDQVSVSSRPREERPEVSEEMLEMDNSVDTAPELTVPEWASGKSLEYYYSGFTLNDVRICALCKGIGDGLPAEEGRLLYCGQNEWTHSNCALWSSEVFEEIDGSLQNVHSAVFRGRKINCEMCGKKGASVGCCSRNCFNTYHFPCARVNGSVFMEDKNVFCPHHTNDSLGKAIHCSEEFDLRRPIYVELDRKKKKYVDPKQVRFMIGSLYMESLGKFASGLSDSVDAILPADFQCTRLYWSTAEPWRIVQYTMKTISPLMDCEEGVDLGRNVTINHDRDESVVKRELEEVAEWHRKLLKSPAEQADIDLMDNQADADRNVIRERMDYILDTITSREVEENAADLLPPELKDAIFEDLPHDLLDGISMQDILEPKLMNYEDFSSMDLKDSCYSSDVDGNNEGKDMSEDAMLNEEVERNTKHEEERNLMKDLWFGDSKDNVEDLIPTATETDTVISHCARELKRSKSEVIAQPVRRSAATRGQQRSCSLTWSCTVDSSKRRKLPSHGTRSGDNLITIDVTAEHKLHELRLPDGVLTSLARSSTPTSLTSEDSDLKEPTSTRHREEEGKENKFWHGRPRLLQVDGAVDSSSSSSEGGSPPPPDVDGDLEKPVKCARCHRTYRTRVSYERHLPTCSSEFILSTSESDSETRSSEGDNTKKACDPTEFPVEKNFGCVTDVFIKPEPGMFPVIVKEERNDTVGNQPVLPLPVSTASIPLQTTIIQNKTPNARTLPRIISYARRGRPPKVKPTPDIQPVKVQSGMVCNNNMATMMMTQPSMQPTVIMQQLPPANMMPTYLDQYQQQSSQNVQYIATIDVQNNSFKPQYLANGIVPGTFQLQSAPESYVGLQNGNVMLPNVQLSQQHPMMGTIIQQPTCSLVSQDQMLLNTAPLEMYQDQSGGMFLSSPQVYYGLETIVSNTVMSSSQVMSSNQFLPGMQGMVAASSSYSATTTQVYQTNKIDPRIDLPTSYVIMPNSQINQGMSNQIPLSLHAPAVTVATRPQNTITNSWSLNTANTYVPKRVVQPAIQKPKPCYMPQCPPPASYRQYPSAVSNSNNTKSVPLMRQMSSFKSTKVHIPVPVMQSHNNSVRQQVPPPKKLEVKPMLKGNAELNRWQQGTETSRANTENQPAISVAVPATKPAAPNTNAVKLVIQKSDKNGFYKITQKPMPVVTMKNVVKEPEPKPKPSEPIVNNKACIPAIILVDKSPLADNAEANQTIKPVKKRWVPKERIKIMPKVSTPSKLMYQVQSQDGFSCTSASVSEVWEKVFEAVQKARVLHKMSPLTKNPFGANIGGLQMLGLSHNGLRYLTEQLTGVNRCVNYKPRYHRLTRPNDEDPETAPIENPSGCGRTEPFIDRSPYDLFSWLASRHRKPPKLVAMSEDTVSGNNRRATSSNLPMAMRFRHLKETSKEAVGVYRSHIHGRGLFCLRDIESGEMVVEYAGEVIRSTLTDYREKLYDRKDIGCYMFRIDDQLVVDATMRGNAARFINHSCEPNCYSKVVDILGKKHILIFALRRIPKGEELTYDYKFPFEDVKIPCTCGSRRCRKHLN